MQVDDNVNRSEHQQAEHVFFRFLSSTSTSILAFSLANNLLSQSTTTATMCMTCGPWWSHPRPTLVADPPVKEEFIYLDANPGWYEDPRKVSGCLRLILK